LSGSNRKTKRIAKSCGKNAERRTLNAKLRRTGRGKRLLALAMKAEAEVRDQRSEISGQRRKNDSLFTLPSSFFLPPYSFSLLLLEAPLFAISRHDPDAPAIEPLNERRSRA